MPINSTNIKLGPEVLANLITHEKLGKRIEKERGKLYLLTYDMLIYLEHRRESMLRLTQRKNI